jgi:hypoxanthine phosphoribosyltransferase
MATTEKQIQQLPFELLLDQATISRRIAEMGQQITEDYKHTVPVLLGVLKGCVIFMSDLVRQIRIPIEMEFISASSYRQGMRAGQPILFEDSLAIPLKGRHVLIVEGIVDTGKTMGEILKTISRQEPASVSIVTLIDKPSSRRSEFELKYVGFTVGNDFLIGFGLDNTQRYRNLPFIGKVVEKK